MLRIGIFGGTFDPIHIAHLFIGQTAAEELHLDKVIYVPTGVVSHKKAHTTNARLRYEMTIIATKDNPIFEVSDYEINKQTPSYSVELVEHFKNVYPNDKIFFIIGEDSLDYIDKWYDAKRLLSMCAFAVIGRGGFESDIEKKIDYLKKNFDSDITHIKSPELEISSNDIRDRISQGKSIKYLVSDDVIEFIKQNEMYQKTGENYDGI